MHVVHFGLSDSIVAMMHKIWQDMVMSKAKYEGEVKIHTNNENVGLDFSCQTHTWNLTWYLCMTFQEEEYDGD